MEFNAVVLKERKEREREREREIAKMEEQRQDSYMASWLPPGQASSRSSINSLLNQDNDQILSSSPSSSSSSFGDLVIVSSDLNNEYGTTRDGSDRGLSKRPRLVHDGLGQGKEDSSFSFPSSLAHDSMPLPGASFLQFPSLQLHPLGAVPASGSQLGRSSEGGQQQQQQQQQHLPPPPALLGASAPVAPSSTVSTLTGGCNGGISDAERHALIEARRQLELERQGLAEERNAFEEQKRKFEEEKKRWAEERGARPATSL